LLVVLASGCGSSGKRAASTESSAAALGSICREAERELLDVNRHTSGNMEFSVAGRQLSEGAAASEKVLEETIGKVRALPPSGAQALALRNLRGSITNFQRLARFLRAHGPSFDDLPAGTLAKFGRDAVACVSRAEVEAKERAAKG
jgi:hypothetical protein